MRLSLALGIIVASSAVSFLIGLAAGEKEAKQNNYHEGFQDGVDAGVKTYLDVIKRVDSPEYAGNIGGAFARGWRASLHEIAEIIKMRLEKENYIG